MSFFLILSKNKVKINDLNIKLVPYKFKLQKFQNDKIQLFYNEFSSFKNNCFKTPNNHQETSCTAWVKIDFTNEQIKIKTDPLGQCPIWYFYNDDVILISTEFKNFKLYEKFNIELNPDSYYLNFNRKSNFNNDFKNIFKLTCGSELNIVINSFQLIVHNPCFINNIPRENPQISIAEAQISIKNALLESVAEIAKIKPAQENIACLLSGGVDSGISTYLAQHFLKAKDSFNLSTSLGNESVESQQTAQYLGMNSTTLKLNEEYILNFFDEAIFKNEIVDGLTAEIVLQMNALLSCLPEHKNFIITGYGSDLIFGGMLNHKEYMQLTFSNNTADLIDRASWSREISPLFAWDQQKIVFNIFWHPKVINTGVQIPVALQTFKDCKEKFILRKLAASEGWLPEQIAFRKKIAMTNGTNVNHLLSKKLKLKDEFSYFEKNKYVLELIKKIIE